MFRVVLLFFALLFITINSTIYARTDLGKFSINTLPSCAFPGGPDIIEGNVKWVCPVCDSLSFNGPVVVELSNEISEHDDPDSPVTTFKIIKSKVSEFDRTSFFTAIISHLTNTHHIFDIIDEGSNPTDYLLLKLTHNLNKAIQDSCRE